jgi:hypothetical protein
MHYEDRLIINNYVGVYARDKSAKVITILPNGEVKSYSDDELKQPRI